MSYVLCLMSYVSCLMSEIYYPIPDLLNGRPYYNLKCRNALCFLWVLITVALIPCLLIGYSIKKRQYMDVQSGKRS